MPSGLPIENIKDFERSLFDKCSNVIRMKSDFDCSEFNFEFSNSGAGASCDIDRIPNKLLLN